MTAPEGARPLLQYTYRLTFPVRIDESLTVYDDGGVWCWSLAPVDRIRRERVGTLGFRLPDSEQREVASLAAELLEELEPEAATQRQNAPEVLLRVPGPDGERVFLLSVAEGLQGALLRAWELANDLRDRAELAPLGVLKLGWRPAVPPLRASEAGAVAFTCENTGVNPVTVLFQAATFSIFAERPSGGWERLWKSEEGQTMGLMDQSGELIDGVLAPATLGPGASGVAVFMDALAAPTVGKQWLGASVEGWITLIRPDGEDDFPRAPFLVESRALEVEVAA